MTVYLVISVFLYAIMTCVGLREAPEVMTWSRRERLAHWVTTGGFAALFTWGTWLLAASL